MTSTPTVAVVTGPDGHDVGPVAAWLGYGLRDGLAVRTVASTGSHYDRRGAHCHASPNPHGIPGERVVPLYALPSAWQNPDTNLGVAYTGVPNRDLAFDIQTLNDLGLNPAHRVTVQHHSGYGIEHFRETGAIPAPVEVGDLAAQARDSVLRGADGSRQVLVEAGDGQTFLDALHTLGLPPWSPHIHRLELWLVFDVAAVLGADGARRGLPLTEQLTAEVARQGGGRGVRGAAVRLALRNAHTLIPGLAGLNGEDFDDRLTDADAEALADLVNDAESATGTRVGLVTTGPGADGFEAVVDLTERLS